MVNLNYIKMKRLIFLLSILLTIPLLGQDKTIPQLPVGSSIVTGDLLILYQGGVTKNLDYQYLETATATLVSDTADVLRQEWQDEIADTAAVLRGEITGAATADTAWQRITSSTTVLEIISDSVGIGTNTPTEKLEVVGNIKAIRAILDNGYNNILIGPNSGESLTSSGTFNMFAGYQVAKDASTPSLSLPVCGSLNPIWPDTKM